MLLGDLPAELLELVAKFIDTPTDIRSFRAVCQLWRSCSSPPPSLLSFGLPHKLRSPRDSPVGVRGPLAVIYKEPLAIIATNTYFLEPLHPDSAENHPKPWMIRVEEFKPGRLRVREPLTHHKPVILPESFPKILSLSRFRVLQVSTGYSFDYNYIRHDVSYDESWVRSFEKLIPQNRKLDPKGTISEALMLCRVGSLYLLHLENEKWDLVKAGLVIKFDDIIHIQGHNYTVDRSGRLYSITSHWSLSCIVSDGQSLREGRKRLVEWCGELYMVQRDGYVIRVHKLNEQRHRWDEVGDLGGKLLVVATDCCFFLNINNFPGLEENTVIFHKDSFPSYLGYFDGEESMISSTSGSCNICMYKWGADRFCQMPWDPAESHMIWPPPVWLRSPPAN